MKDASKPHNFLELPLPIYRHYTLHVIQRHTDTHRHTHNHTHKYTHKLTCSHSHCHAHGTLFLSLSLLFSLSFSLSLSRTRTQTDTHRHWWDYGNRTANEWSVCMCVCVYVCAHAPPPALGCSKHLLLIACTEHQFKFLQGNCPICSICCTVAKQLQVTRIVFDQKSRI